MNTGALESRPRPTAGLLTPDEYRLLVGPTLKAAADIAASRNDPDLFHDIASMLALIAMMTALIRLYRALPAPAEARSSDADLDAAPLAACALVFTRAGMTPDEVKPCLHALPEAYRLLVQDGTLGPAAGYSAQVERAWQALQQSDEVMAHQQLLLAAQAIVQAVDLWERSHFKESP